MGDETFRKKREREIMYDYDPDKKPKTSKEQRDSMMKKFLAKGGKVQKLEPGYPINVGSMDRSKKPACTKEEIKKGAKGHAPKPNYDTYKPGSYHDYDVGGDNPPVYIGSNNEKKNTR